MNYQTIKLNKNVKIYSNLGDIDIKKNNIYIFDFPATKRTINIGYTTKYVNIPPYTVLLNAICDYSYEGYDYLLMGERNNNIIAGLNINGGQPWVCSPEFRYLRDKKIINPEDDIKKMMYLFWNTPFPKCLQNPSKKILDITPLFNPENYENI